MKRVNFQNIRLSIFLKNMNQAKQLRIFVGNMVFQPLPFINGNRNTEVWMPSI